MARSSYKEDTEQQTRYDVRRYLSIKASSSPKFSSDDSFIAYLSDVTGVPQVWGISINEEDCTPELLTFLDERVGFLSYAKTGDYLAYGVDAGGNERYQIHVIVNKGEKFIPVTNEPEVIHYWGDFSRDTRKILYSSNRRNQAFFDVYTQEISGFSEPEMVYKSDETNYAIEFHPKNEGKVLFEKQHAPFNQDLFLLDAKTGQSDLLTEHRGDAAFRSCTFERPSGDAILCVSDLGREFSGLARIDLQSKELEYIYKEDNADVEEIAQTGDGEKIALNVNRDGYSDILVIDRKNKDSTPEKVTIPHSIAAGLEWSRDSTKLAFTLSSQTLNTDVWIYDFKDRKLLRLINSSVSGLPRESFVSPDLVRCRSFDELEISGFVYLPKKNEQQRAPLVVWIHGGPESQYRPTFNPIIQYLLSRGIAVAAPNFRGSTGYGRTFTHLDDVRGRMNTVKDVERFVSHLRSDPSLEKQIDFSRVAAFGGSYGGFMVLACLYENPEIWAAGVDIVGIANFVTFLRNTGPWRRKLRIAEYGDPDIDSEFLTRISPVSNAEKIKAPLFVIHGTNDPRVPFGEAEQIVETLRKLGREVHLMKFEDEGHGLVKTKNRIVGYSAAIEFLGKHLKP